MTDLFTRGKSCRILNGNSKKFGYGKYIIVRLFWSRHGYFGSTASRQNTNHGSTKLASHAVEVYQKGTIRYKFELLIHCRITTQDCIRGTKRLVSANICSVEGNSADIFVSKVPAGIFVMKVK